MLYLILLNIPWSRWPEGHQCIWQPAPAIYLSVLCPPQVVTRCLSSPICDVVLLSLRLFLFPCTVRWNIVLASSVGLVTWPYHFNFHLFIVVSKSSWDPSAFVIMMEGGGGKERLLCSLTHSIYVGSCFSKENFF